MNVSRQFIALLRYASVASAILLASGYVWFRAARAEAPKLMVSSKSAPVAPSPGGQLAPVVLPGSKSLVLTRTLDSMADPSGSHPIVLRDMMLMTSSKSAVILDNADLARMGGSASEFTLARGSPSTRPSRYRPPLLIPDASGQMTELKIPRLLFVSVRPTKPVDSMNLTPRPAIGPTTQPGGQVLLLDP